MFAALGRRVFVVALAPPVNALLCVVLPSNAFQAVAYLHEGQSQSQHPMNWETFCWGCAEVQMAQGCYRAPRTPKHPRAALGFELSRCSRRGRSEYPCKLWHVKYWFGGSISRYVSSHTFMQRSSQQGQLSRFILEQRPIGLWTPLDLTDHLGSECSSLAHGMYVWTPAFWWLNLYLPSPPGGNFAPYTWFSCLKWHIAIWNTVGYPRDPTVQ